eukprot:Lithocolla_globosa_v1_NODE_852_length_3187_cov_14.982439.p1 type:complete len:1016 gc:universal NODE_852_length_3187_cov_14.982439:3097-50(-)
MFARIDSLKSDILMSIYFLIGIGIGKLSDRNMLRLVIFGRFLGNKEFSVKINLRMADAKASRTDDLIGYSMKDRFSSSENSIDLWKESIFEQMFNQNKKKSQGSREQGEGSGSKKKKRRMPNFLKRSKKSSGIPEEKSSGIPEEFEHSETITEQDSDYDGEERKVLDSRLGFLARQWFPRWDQVVRINLKTGKFLKEDFYHCTIKVDEIENAISTTATYSNNPEWFQQFDLHVSDNFGKLIIMVWNQKHQPVSKAIFPKSFVTESKGDISSKLTPPTIEDSISGELQIGLIASNCNVQVGIKSARNLAKHQVFVQIAYLVESAGCDEDDEGSDINIQSISSYSEDSIMSETSSIASKKSLTSVEDKRAYLTVTASVRDSSSQRLKHSHSASSISSRTKQQIGNLDVEWMEVTKTKTSDKITNWDENFTFDLLLRQPDRFQGIIIVVWQDSKLLKMDNFLGYVFLDREEVLSSKYSEMIYSWCPLLALRQSHKYTLMKRVSQTLRKKTTTDRNSNLKHLAKYIAGQHFSQEDSQAETNNINNVNNDNGTLSLNIQYQRNMILGIPAYVNIMRVLIGRCFLTQKKENEELVSSSSLPSDLPSACLLPTSSSLPSALPSTSEAAEVNNNRSDNNEEKLGLVIGLGKVITNKENLAHSLLKIFEFFDGEEIFLENILDYELSMETAETLFRQQSLFSKAFEQFLRHKATSLLLAFMQPILTHMHSPNISYETDPTRVSNVEDRKRNRDNLEEALNLIIFFLTHTIRRKEWDSLTNELRRVFIPLRAKVTKLFPKKENLGHIAVTTFFFLRFLVPAILNPILFYLTDDVPTPQQLRNQTLLAKLVQNWANLTEYSEKESYMEKFNIILKKQFNNAKAIINFLSLSLTSRSVSLSSLSCNPGSTTSISSTTSSVSSINSAASSNPPLPKIDFENFFISNPILSGSDYQYALLQHYHTFPVDLSLECSFLYNLVIEHKKELDDWSKKNPKYVSEEQLSELTRCVNSLNKKLVVVDTEMLEMM